MSGEEGERYEHVDQRPFCCVPACLQMVLERRGIEPDSQEDIGYELGLVIPERYAEVYVDEFDRVRVEPDHVAGGGTQVHLEEFSINAYFDRHDIPLEKEYVPADGSGGLEEELYDRFSAGADVMVCFDNGVLYEIEAGHVALVDALEGDTVWLMDPREELQQFSLEELVEAMEVHGEEKLGGLWVVSERAGND